MVSKTDPSSHKLKRRKKRISQIGKSLCGEFLKLRAHITSLAPLAVFAHSTVFVLLFITRALAAFVAEIAIRAILARVLQLQGSERQITIISLCTSYKEGMKLKKWKTSKRKVDDKKSEQNARNIEKKKGRKDEFDEGERSNRSLTASA
jgi:hypothetical protein